MSKYSVEICWSISNEGASVKNGIESSLFMPPNLLLGGGVMTIIISSGIIVSFSLCEVYKQLATFPWDRKMIEMYFPIFQVACQLFPIIFYM